MNKSINQSVIDKFHHVFPNGSREVRLFFAPGRVNLIGEHIDYNGGYVLPTALTLGTYMVVRARKDNKFNVRSENFPDNLVTFDLDQIHYDESDLWGNYPKGIVKELRTLKVPLSGADAFYYGTIPNGAGLSSSASIGMVTAFGLCQLANYSISMKDLAFLCQRMENHFIGVNTGIMDQTAVGFGKDNHAIFLNCLTYSIDLIPLNLDDYKIIMTNTNKRRGLADSKYNERRRECEAGLEVLQTLLTELTCLGELSYEGFMQYENLITDPIIKKRVRHVMTENHRVLQATQHLKNNHLLQFGELMKHSHESLRDDYEVTGLELDTLFDVQKEASGCIGTRMTGAGFGGCTVSLVKEKQIAAFKEVVSQSYYKVTHLTPTFYTCDAGQGVTELRGISV